MDQILRKSSGLLWGVVVQGGSASCVTDETFDEAAPNDWCWLHFALSDHRARRYLENLADTPEPAREILLGDETRLQLHFAPGMAWGMVPDIEKDFADETLDSGRVAFWLDGTRLITVRHHPMRVVNEVRRAAEAGDVPATPAAALARVMERYAEIVDDRVAHLTRELDQFEDFVLSDRTDLDQSRLGPIRRELSRYRREFVALRSALHRANNGRNGGGQENPLSPLLPDIMQVSEDVDRDVSALEDRARLIYEEMDTRIAATTNRSLATLTVLSTLLLPPTFIAGAFGMNLPDIPWMNTHGGFWWAVGLCFVVVGICWAALKRAGIL